jgi:hypothetical protein
MKTILSAIFISLNFAITFAQTLPIPPRQADALSGSEFVNVIWSMPRELREEAIYSQIINGNIPNFMRQLSPIISSANIGGSNHSAVYFVVPEYLAVGSDSDYFLCPMSPLLAQRICNAINSSLPTKKMVDQIYTLAPCKLRPQPIPPSAQMITVPVFAQHNDSVKSIRFPVLSQYPFGTLVGGTKKDVIISNYIYQNLKPNVLKPVVIYGWHQLNGVPIQPVYNGHEETYADYSHGIRLVLDSVVVDGEPRTITQLLADPLLCQLISDEGTILKPYYTFEGNLTPTPKSFGVIWNSPTSLKICTNSTAIGTVSYKAFWGNDGLFFNDSTEEFIAEVIVDGLQTDSVFFFRLRAQSTQGYSLFSEVLAAIPSSSAPQALIVNGFDRGSSGNTYNFIRQHGIAFMQNGYSFCSVTNEAVLDGLVSLSDYSIVDYILGDESTANETFSSAEQESLKVFLKNGGRFFVSGSEIAWDLDYKGSTSDKDFIYNFLKCQYVNDAPNNQAGVFYQAESILNSIFDGVGAVNFDNGSQGTINVRYPDVITGVNGSVNCLQYTNVTNQFAGISFQGIFQDAAIPGKVVFVGFPFETIYPEATRNLFLNKVISFFNKPVGSTEEIKLEQRSFQLYQNYPNPFNPTTRISWQSPSSGWQVLKVFDVLGKEITTLVNEEREAGYHSVEFDASNLSSGIYLYRLKTENYSAERKMIVLK